MENQSNIGNQDIQPISQNSVVQPAVLDKPKNNFVVTLTVGLVCSIVFGVGGYFLGKQYWQSQKYINEEQNRNPFSAPTSQVDNSVPTIDSNSVSDPIANWKVYTSDKYGFSFKYPQDYEVEERVDGFFVITALRGEDVPQGGISIDARLQGIFETYEKAINYYTTSLELSYNVQNPNLSVFVGVGKEGQIKGVEFQNAIFRYKTGALGLETVNVEPYKSVFGTILSNFTINK